MKQLASDADVLFAARVSTKGESSLDDVNADTARSKGLINYLMRDRHGTPFEHNSMTFFVSAPIFVFREFMRHRIGFSYNEESGRYRQLEPVFYVPGPTACWSRKASRAVTFSPPAPPSNTRWSKATKDGVRARLRRLPGDARAGVAREVARGVLPVATYSSMYVTCNARSLMALLSLRTKREDSRFPSFPQREIEMVAEKMEAEWAR